MKDILFKNNNKFYSFLINKKKFIDRSDSVLYWTTVFHMFGVLHHVYICAYAVIIDVRPSSNECLDNLYRYQPGFATGWNFVLQTCFLAISLVYDILEWIERHDSLIPRRLKYCRDIIFSGLIVPVTIFISTFFWIIYWVDRDLVFPKFYDQLVPWWYNHCVHTNILIVLGLETLLQARRYPTNRKVELWLTGIIGVGYAMVYYSIYFATNRWLYGVFGIMTWWQVCLFQILIWAYMYIVYIIQFPINRIFHREDLGVNKESTRLANEEQNGQDCLSTNF